MHQNTIRFILDDKEIELDFKSDPVSPTTTVLNYLRNIPFHKGVKEGCAEGDCGACTVVVAEENENNITYKAVDSCLLFLPQLHGKQLITVENLASKNEVLHPVQQAMVDTDGSQCGFCTPGIVMSLFALYKNHTNPDRDTIVDSLTGNLCRCTGYKSIITAASVACVQYGTDHFNTNKDSVTRILQNINFDTRPVFITGDAQLYIKPFLLKDALYFRKKYPEAIVISGATDIALRVTKKHERLNSLLDISSVKELQVVRNENKYMLLGACLPLSTVMQNVKTKFPPLYSILKVFGSGQIRNLATLGGNIATCSPIGDTLPVLLACSASVVISNTDTQHELLLSDFIIGYRKTKLKDDELLIAIKIPYIRSNEFIRSYKVSKRRDLDISTVSACFYIKTDKDNYIEDCRFFYGGMAEVTKRAKNAEEYTKGKLWNHSTAENAALLISKEFNPISDARSGAQFRKKVSGNLLIKFWYETMNDNE